MKSKKPNAKQHYYVVKSLFFTTPEHSFWAWDKKDIISIFAVFGPVTKKEAKTFLEKNHENGYSIVHFSRLFKESGEIYDDIEYYKNMRIDGENL